MTELISDDRLLEAFAERKRRQWRVVWLGFPALIAWLAVSAFAFHALVATRPALDSPILMMALVLPGGFAFVVLAARFTARNLRCPSCDRAIRMYGTRYYGRHFDCPHCGRALSR